MGLYLEIEPIRRELRLNEIIGLKILEIGLGALIQLRKVSFFLVASA